MELARELANPVAALISLPLQYKYDENYGLDDGGSVGLLNIQPVIPFDRSDRWNLITRTIIPFKDQQDVPMKGTEEWVPGDITACQYFSPMESTADGSETAVAGALLSVMNTASEYGFGGVIASLPGFLIIADALKAIPGVLVNEAITLNALDGITGSASGGMSIALATMSDTFIAAANRGVAPHRLHVEWRYGYPAA